MRRSVLILPFLLSGASCSGTFCTSKTIKSLRSPDGNHVAIMFMRECGATTDFTTQVSVDPWFWQSIGNAFVAEGYNGGTRGPWGGPWAEVQWTGSDDLLISYDEKARVFERNVMLGNVRVSYRAVAR